MRTDFPIAASSPPNSRCQAGQLSITTLGAPVFVSAVRQRSAACCRHAERREEAVADDGGPGGRVVGGARVRDVDTP